jgi:hypothetical protein
MLLISPWCHYAECRYAECCFADCRGAVKTTIVKVTFVKITSEKKSRLYYRKSKKPTTNYITADNVKLTTVIYDLKTIYKNTTLK